MDTDSSPQRPILTTIRPVAPEPEITADALPDPLGDLAAPGHLRLEQYLPGDVLGGARPAPRISWEIASAPAGWRATGAELEITRTDLAGAPIAAPTRLPLATADGVLAAWPAAPLASRERVVLRVRVTGLIVEAAAAPGATTAQPPPLAPAAPPRLPRPPPTGPPRSSTRPASSPPRTGRRCPWAPPGRRTPAPTAVRRACAASSR